MEFLKELGIPFLCFIIFFLFQSKKVWKEKFLTFAIIFISIFTAFISYHQNELLLFIIGLFFGIVIEVGMRRLGYQQIWNDASFFGVPYWLPLIWGFGFVIITRLGIFILGL
jgi:hypothetical protein